VRVLTRVKSLWIVLALLAAAFSGCSGDPSPAASERGAGIVGECSGHRGVVAFDDDAVICGDQTARGARGVRAVDACRAHGGVTAFDDNVVICRDQTVQEAEEG
jgi:hypothetical protein